MGDGRRGARQTGADQSDLQRRQVHQPGLRRPDRPARTGSGRKSGAALHRRGQRHRLRRRDARAAVQPVRTGRRRHHPQVRRVGPGPVDLPPAGGNDGRRSGLRERAGQRRGLHPDPAAKAMRRASGGRTGRRGAGTRRCFARCARPGRGRSPHQPARHRTDSGADARQDHNGRKRC